MEEAIARENNQIQNDAEP